MVLCTYSKMLTQRPPVAPRAMNDQFAAAFLDAAPKVSGPAEPLVMGQYKLAVSFLELEESGRMEYAVEVDENDLLFHTSTAASVWSDLRGIGQEPSLSSC